MKKLKLNIIPGIVFLAVLLYVSGCNKVTDRGTGSLNGTISIGPICPAETEPPGPGCLPTAETYKAYPVGIWTSNGSKRIAMLDPSLDGSYKIDIEAGYYLVILENEQNKIARSNLPVWISITPGQATILDINIDTGIR